MLGQAPGNRSRRLRPPVVPSYRRLTGCRARSGGAYVYPTRRTVRDRVPLLGTQLAAQPGDMHVDGPAVAHMPGPPDGGHQLVAAVHPVRMGHQMREQFELQVRQVQRAPVHRGGAPGTVDLYRFAERGPGVGQRATGPVPAGSSTR